EAHSDWVAEATTGPNWDAQADVTSETTDNALGETREAELSATVAPLPAASADSGSGEVRGRLGSLAAGAAGLAGAGIAGAASRIAAFRRDRQADASADATEGDPHVATASPFADPWNAKPPVAATDDAAVQGDAVDDDVPSPDAEATAESSWTAPEGDVVTEESSWAAPEGGAVAADDGLSDGDVVAEESSWSDGAVEPSSLEEVAAAVDTDAVAEAGGVNLVWDGDSTADAGDAGVVNDLTGDAGDGSQVEESAWSSEESVEDSAAADDGLSDGDIVAEESSWSDGAVEPSSLEEVAAAVDTDAVAEAGGVNLVWDGETVSDAGDAAAVEVAAGEGGDVVNVEESAWSVDAPAEDAAPSDDAPAGAEADGTSADVAQVEESSWSDADVEPSSLDEVAAAVDTEAVAEAGGVNLVWDGNPDASAESVGTDAEVQAWPVDDGAEQRVVEGSDGSDEVQAWPVDDTSRADGDAARDADAASGEGSESGHVGGYGDHGYGAHEAASAYGPPDDAGDAGGDSVVVHDHAVIDGGWSVGSAAPIEDGCMPLGHPIKGVYALGIYQVPGSGWYDQTTPDVWFLDEEAAQRAGFRRGEG
ncbi:MAG TPA: hypothetical protein PKH97_04715, partial [Tetrasphaera sp.]|nr:hypothetical protein [Tetrasphaera sp.]